MKIKISRVEFNRRCKPLLGDEIMHHGLESPTIMGIIHPNFLEELLIAVEDNPELHIASFDKRFAGVNYYVPDMDYYYLCGGDSDPNIEIMSSFDDPQIRITRQDFLNAIADFREMLNSPEEEEEHRQLNERFALGLIKLKEKKLELAARKRQWKMKH